jgi:branched-chain amino acid transport system ATP-binding protein
MSTILETRKLVKRFGGLTAVNHVDLVVPQKTICSVIGPNGAGKTTFFNCITGFYVPDEGTVLFRGEPITGFQPDKIARIGIARTYQNIRLFSSMTAIENVMVGHHPRMHANALLAVFRTPGMMREERKTMNRARELLDFVGLRGKEDWVSRSLPYGDQRRLEIARALANEPALLLLDEPTAGMNPRETEQLIHFVRRLRDELNLSILLIEHDMRVVMGLSDEITVLDYGTKIAHGTPEEVRTNPAVIEAYLGRPMEEQQ